MPTRSDAAWHRVRVWGHVLLRVLRDMTVARVERHRSTDDLKEAAVLAERRTPLWRDGSDDEFPLVAGKVHNLRLARLAFDGVVVPAGSVFSFWRQLGQPSRWRGFVEGREVRAGCVIPTIAGGLCQLSNALATCAARCGMTLLERHGHTARIEQDSPADGPPQSIDATVFWNYVDLRFAAPFDFRIEVELTSDELVVRLRAAHALAAAGQVSSADLRSISIVAEKIAAPVARGCLTCDETDCFRHRDRTTRRIAGAAAVLVNAWTPEFASHLRDHSSNAKWFLPWVRPSRRTAGAWEPPASSKRTVALAASLRRTLHIRGHAGEGGGRQAAVLRGDRWIAESHARRLCPRHTHLIVDQSLLVPLAQSGVLGGRSYEVLLHALPADEIQRRLDAAAQRWPGAASLQDFRIGETHCEAEGRALRGAQRLVTPHADVARHLRATCGVPVECIDWHVPPHEQNCARSRAHGTRPVVAFPASALARKGALDMAEAMRHLGWRLLVLGTPPSDPRMWHGIDVEYVGYRDPAWLVRADVVALPAYIEHSPRGLLAAIAQGLPVIASPACGLPASLGAIEVAAGDIPGLISALKSSVPRHRLGT